MANQNAKVILSNEMLPKWLSLKDFCLQDLGGVFVLSASLGIDVKVFSFENCFDRECKNYNHTRNCNHTRVKIG